MSISKSADYPVDSVTRPCCGGIGAHAPNCVTIPLPAGATKADPWLDVDTAPWRVVYFFGHQVAEGRDASVAVSTVQRGNGRVEDYAIYLNGTRLSSGQTRELAGAMIEAANTMDRKARS